MEDGAGGWRAWRGSWGSFERELIGFFLRRPTPPSPEPVEGLETAADGATSPEGMTDSAWSVDPPSALAGGAMNAPAGALDNAALCGSDPADWPVVSGVSRLGAHEVFRGHARRARLAGEGSAAVGDAIADPWATEGTAWVGSCPDGASQGADLDDRGADGADAGDDGQEGTADICASN